MFSPGGWLHLLGHHLRDLQPSAAEAVPADGRHVHREPPPARVSGGGLHLQLHRHLPRAVRLRCKGKEGGGTFYILLGYC